MSKISQEQALEVFREAEKKGTLKPSTKLELAYLIGAEIRPEVERALDKRLAKIYERMSNQ